MNEKASVSDTLSELNTVINMLTYSVQQANDKNFRDTCQQFRNVFENIQWNTYEIAKQKGYYKPAAPAGQADIEQVKEIVQNC